MSKIKFGIGALEAARDNYKILFDRLVSRVNNSNSFTKIRGWSARIGCFTRQFHVYKISWNFFN